MDSLRTASSRDLLTAGFGGMFFCLSIGTSPLFIFGGLVLAVWILSGRFLKDLGTWPSTGMMIPVLLLLVLPWIGLLYTPLPSDGMSIAVKSYYWLFSIAFLSIARDSKRDDVVLKMFLAGLSLNSAVAILQYIGVLPLKNGHPVGLFPGSSPWIAFSILLAAGTIIASFYFSRECDARKRLIYLSLIVEYLSTIAFVGGRSGYLAIILLFPILLHHILKQGKIVKLIFFGILFCSLLATFPVIKKRVLKGKEDIELYRQGIVNTSIGLRIHMWEIALSEIEKNPLTGSGTGSFRRSWEVQKRDPSLPFYDHPHNSFLYMMVSFGIPGLIALSWLLLVMIRKGWRARDRSPGFSVFAFTVVFVVGSLTDTQILPTPTTMALSLFSGIAGGMNDG